VSVRRHAEALLDATRRLERRLAGEEAGGLDEAVRAREAAFETLRAAAGDRPPADARELLREVREIDARLLARAALLQDRLRRERTLLGVARDAARSVRPDERPRFLEVRV